MVKRPSALPGYTSRQRRRTYNGWQKLLGVILLPFMLPFMIVGMLVYFFYKAAEELGENMYEIIENIFLKPKDKPEALPCHKCGLPWDGEHCDHE